MSSVASSHLVSFFLWSFIPPLFAALLLRTTYFIFPAARPRLPPSPTQSDLAVHSTRTTTHARRARTILVASYLFYTVLSLYLAQASLSQRNHYDLLGLPRSVLDEAGSDGAAQIVKSHWRRLARVYHPDKVGRAGEAYFVRLRSAVEVIEDDGRRWAYSRFGEQVREWKLPEGKESEGVRPFLVRGAQQSIAFYVFAGASVMLMGLRRDERGNGFWRIILLAITLSLEFHLLLTPSPSPLFSLLLPFRETYQHIEFLRQLFISASMALSQLLPLFRPPVDDAPTVLTPQERARKDAEALWPIIERLRKIARMAESEVSSMIGLELRPLVPVEAAPGGDHPNVVANLKREMRETYLDLKLKTTKQGQEVWGNAVVVGRERELRARGGRANMGAARRPSSPSPSLAMVGGGLRREAGGGWSGNPAHEAVGVRAKVDENPGRLPSPPPE